MIVELTEQEEQLADQAAAAIDESANKFNGVSKLGISRHQLSCRGQMAFAKLTGAQFNGACTVRVAKEDVAKQKLINGCRIRTIARANQTLLVRPNHGDDEFAVLCLNYKPGTYEFLGYALTKEVKENGILADYMPLPAHFIPNSQLKPISELLEIINAERSNNDNTSRHQTI